VEIGKSAYLICLTVILFILVGCFIESVNRKSKISRAILVIVVAAFLSIFSFASSICTQNLTVAKFLYSFYYSMLDVSIFAAFNLAISLNEGNVTFYEKNSLLKIWKTELTKAEKFVFIFYGILCLFDIISIYILTFTSLNIQPVFKNGHFYCWRISYQNQFIIHLIICYTLATCVTIKLIKNMVLANVFNKPIYIVILILYSVELTLNAIYITNICRWRIDYSMIGYGIVTIVAFTFSMYTVPKKVQNHMLSIATDTISDAVICFDEKLRCLYKNKSACQIYQEDTAALTLRRRHCSWMEKYFNSPENHINNTEKLKVNGSNRIYQLEFHRFTSNSGKIWGCYFKLNDKTVEVENLKKEEYRANHDELTGLLNRNSFFSEAEKILRLYPEVPRYLVCTNIKNFKIINELFGTKYGDELLRRQATMLKYANYENVVIGRISGDKFAMLINKENFNPELAIGNTYAVKDLSKNVNYPLQIKIGVYEIANSFENVHTMYDKAYLAIKNNEDSSKVIVMYDTSLMEKLRYEKNITSEFKYAVKNNQFFMFLQAQIDSKTEKCIGAEALVRWYDINTGYRQPGEFIQILEKSGLIYQLDYFIWEKAVQTLSKWKREGFDNTYISVNISARDFYFADLYQEFVNLVEKYNVSPKMLNLEITESVLIDNKKLHKSILAKLQDYGFRIEMDDFGSGYSSLNVLKDISIDVLKIDMGFLRHSENENRGQLIINLIVKMAQDLGLAVVCEGVETEEQKKFLTKAGVDIFQGYLYSKPVPLAEFERKYLEVKQ